MKIKFLARPLFALALFAPLAAAARGETLEQTRKSVNLEELRRLFAGDSKVRNTLFTVYVVGPAVASAYNDATAKQ